MEEGRGTGKTTGLMIKCIGESSLANGKWVEFIDHYEVTIYRANSFKKSIENYIKLLRLNAEVKTESNRVFVRSKVND